MSLFDDLIDDNSGFSEQAFGPQEGFAGVLLCASACDGHIADEEAQSLFMTLHQKKLYSRLTEQQFGSVMDRLMGMLKRGGPGKLLEKAVPAVPPELRETAFASCVDIVLADGTLEQEEKEFIEELKLKLEIDQARAKAIVQVMVYKNYG